MAWTALRGLIGLDGEERGPTAVRSPDESDPVHWVVTLNTERNFKFKDKPHQLRAEPPVIHISPRVVIDTELGLWLKSHRMRYVACLLLFCKFLLVFRVPGSTRIRTEFDKQEHEMWRRQELWYITDGALSVALFVLLLHYTNRDLLRRQLFAFDTLVIVGNYFWWYLTRAFSEYCVFNSKFDMSRYMAHALDTTTTLPLIVIAACFDSVKMAHRTKIVIITLMVVERCFQYMKYREDSGIFSDHGNCPLFGIQFECANLQGTHLSSNMTVIVFFLKSCRAYASGEHFAVVKPRYKMVVKHHDAEDTAPPFKMTEVSATMGPEEFAARLTREQEDKHVGGQANFRTSRTAFHFDTKDFDVSSLILGDSEAVPVRSDHHIDAAFRDTAVFHGGLLIRTCASPPSSPTSSVKDMMKFLSQQNVAADSEGAPAPAARPEHQAGERPREEEAELGGAVCGTQSESPSFAGSGECIPEAVVPPALRMETRGGSIVPTSALCPRGPVSMGRTLSEQSQGSEVSGSDIDSIIRAREKLQLQIEAYMRDLSIFRAQLKYLDTQVFQYSSLTTAHMQPPQRGSEGSTESKVSKASRASKASKASTIYENAFLAS